MNWTKTDTERRSFMQDEALYDLWWREQTEGEQRMEDEHVRHWSKVISQVMEDDFRNFSVLDFGCNQGGFLRFLYERKPFREGVGIDLATQSVALANERKGAAPLHYEATSTPEKYAHRFDLAFSISVIYLIGDLKTHAWKMKQSLKPGGVYYATYTDYSGNPSLPHIREKINRHGSLSMNLHTLDDIVQAFFQEGFEVGISRLLPDRFIDVSPQERWFLRLADRMQYEYEQAYIFRLVAPYENKDRE
jgi:SAM-dependent methyltransferase